MILAEKTDRSITPYGMPGEALDDQVRQRPDAIALSFLESGGFILVPLNSHYRRDDLSYALEQSGGIAIFLSRAFRSNTYLENLATARPFLPRLRHAILFDADDGENLNFEALIVAAPDGLIDMAASSAAVERLFAATKNRTADQRERGWRLAQDLLRQ